MKKLTDAFGFERTRQPGPKPVPKVTLKGCKEELGLGDDVIEIDFPLVAALNRISLSFDGIELILPDDMMALHGPVGECLHQLNWLKGTAYAAWLNKETILNRALPTSKLAKFRPPEHTTAIIVGNGFTTGDFFQGLDWSAYGLFSCWHALPKLSHQGITPDYVCHLDWNMPDGFSGSEYLPDCRYIGTGSCAPEFWEIALKGKGAFVYYDANDAMDHLVANEMKQAMNAACGSTISELCIHAAALAGYTSIVLVGVDLIERPAQLPHESKYYHMLKDIVAIPPMYPGVKFYDAGLGGLLKKGYETLFRDQLIDGRIVEAKQVKRSKLVLKHSVKKDWERKLNDTEGN